MGPLHAPVSASHVSESAPTKRALLSHVTLQWPPSPVGENVTVPCGISARGAHCLPAREKRLKEIDADGFSVFLVSKDIT